MESMVQVNSMMACRDMNIIAYIVNVDVHLNPRMQNVKHKVIGRMRTIKLHTIWMSKDDKSIF